MVSLVSKKDCLCYCTLFEKTITVYGVGWGCLYGSKRGAGARVGFGQNKGRLDRNLGAWSQGIEARSMVIRSFEIAFLGLGYIQYSSKRTGSVNLPKDRRPAK